MAGAWFLGRTRWRRNWRGLVFLAVVAGLVGGTVIGALAGARRTATVYDRLVDASDAPDGRLTAVARPDTVAKFLAETPSVAHAERSVGFIGRRSPNQNWYALDAPQLAATRETPVLARGRLADPSRADEATITLGTARNTGLDVGDELTFHAYASDQIDAAIADPWTPPTGPAITVRIVGVVRHPSDAQLSQTAKIVFGTPALAQQHLDASPTTTFTIWLDGGSGSYDAFARELSEFSRGLPEGEAPFESIRAEAHADSANQAARAVVIGLLIFAAVAGVAGFATVIQAMRRQLERSHADDDVLIALGAQRVLRVGDHLVEAIPVLVLAPLLAVGIAITASWWFPLGSLRGLEPDPGFDADLLPLVVGGLGVFVVLLAITAVIASWDAGARMARTRRPTRAHPATADAAMLPTEIGLAFALRPASNRRAIWGASLAGVLVAVTGVVASTLFVTSVDAFTGSSDRYGVPYDLTLEIAADRSAAFLEDLATEPELDAVGAVHGGAVEIEGRSVDAYAIDPIKGTIEPAVQSGRGPTSETEIALGPRLLDRLDRKIGDDITVTTPSASRRLRIVGTVLSPVPESNDFNSEVLLTPSAFQRFAAEEYVQAVASVRSGADATDVMADLDRRYPYAVSDESLPNAPGPVRNVEQISRLPVALALFFAFLGAAALAQALFVTANERGRDLAVLRALGFTRSQSRGVLVAAAVSVAVVACAIGIPLGLLLGRVGWRTVATNMFVTPHVVVPAAVIAAATIGLVLFAIAVAIVRARGTNRLTPGAALRSE